MGFGLSAQKDRIMTRKEFENLRMSIESEKFLGDCSDPITYGIERALFEKEKFRRLIATAKQVDMQTARTKLEQWKRQLERAGQSQQRFEKIRDELRASRAQNAAMPMVAASEPAKEGH
jgi:hypothetical protein